MAFQQGLSGLNTSSKALDAISNNVANSSTVGFKSSNAHFADVFASSLAGGGASQIGIGTSLASVMQQYTQGNITTTNNPLDISINGNGFYRMDSNGSISYTRNGQFHLDKNGYIINDQSMKLTGYPANASGTIVPSTPQNLQVSAADMAPVATGASVGGSFQGVKAVLNLDSRSALPTTTPWANGGASGQWSPSPNTYNYSTALSVYDTLGNAHTLTFYFAKTGSGTWDVHTNVDGTTDAYVTPNTQAMTFDSSGQILTGGTMTITNIDLASIGTDTGKPNNGTIPSFTIDFTGTTQFGSTFGTNTLAQDGYSSGRLTGLSVGSDGVIQGRYSNGQTRNQGQIVLANFTNPNGLQSLGNNQWSETSVSGAPLVGAPNTASLGVLQSNSVEESNVDLTGELVNMITAQRNYQANAQSIKTQDQIMQTLVNLR